MKLTTISSKPYLLRLFVSIASEWCSPMVVSASRARYVCCESLPCNGHLIHLWNNNLILVIHAAINIPLQIKVPVPLLMEWTGISASHIAWPEEDDVATLGFPLNIRVSREASRHASWSTLVKTTQQCRCCVGRVAAQRIQNRWAVGCRRVRKVYEVPLCHTWQTWAGF